MTPLTLPRPQRHSRIFLIVAALVWLTLYQALAPTAQALVAMLPVDPASQMLTSFQP